MMLSEVAESEEGYIEDEKRGDPPKTNAVRVALYVVGAAVIALYAAQSPVVVAVLAVLALLPAFIAYRKGRSVVGWWMPASSPGCRRS
jgi:disulfide bond formation protein DsbB